MGAAFILLRSPADTLGGQDGPLAACRVVVQSAAAIPLLQRPNDRRFGHFKGPDDVIVGLSRVRESTNCMSDVHSVAHFA